MPFRASGLLPGAKLELVPRPRTPAAVHVALQLPGPDAKRLVRSFPADISLWQILRQFESHPPGSDTNLNITARAVARPGSPTLYYEAPVLQILGRELASLEDLQKSLSRLGHNSGNLLLRLSYRTTDQTMPDAMREISQFFNDAAPSPPGPPDAVPEAAPPEPTQPPSQPPSSTETAIPPAADEDAAGATLPVQPAPSDPSQTGDLYQPVDLFLAPTSTTPAAALASADDEADYVPTVAHAQLHQARLQESARNRRLLSDAELAAQDAAHESRLAAIKSVLVKVRFPDNTSGHWQVGPADGGDFLYAAVRHLMAAKDQPFRLVLPGPKPVVIRDKGGSGQGLIRAYGFSGRVLVNLVWDEAVPASIRKQSFLHADVAQKAQPLRVPTPPAATTAEDDTDRMPIAEAPAKVNEGRADGGAKKLPKWFKLGKK